MNISTFTFGCLALAFSCNSFAKIQNYNYSDEMCDYKTSFDDGKISIKQIKDSLELIRLATSMKLDAEDSFYALHQVPSQQQLNKFEQSYLKQKAALSALSPATQPKYQGLKSVVLRQLKDEYEFYQLKLRAYQNPQVLLTQRYGQRCYAIAQRMNYQGENLIRTSRAFTLEYVEQQRKAGLQYSDWYKEQIQRFDSEIKQSSHKNSYAFDNLMFHWHNCVIASLPNDEQVLAKLNPQKELFVKSKVSCDD